MQGERQRIRARLAIFLGSAIGGFYWALLSTLLINNRRGGVNTTVFSYANLLLVIVVSALTNLAGLVLVLKASTTEGRTLGVALIVCALSGWIVFASTVLQLFLWRL